MIALCECYLVYKTTLNKMPGVSCVYISGNFNVTCPNAIVLQNHNTKKSPGPFKLWCYPIIRFYFT